MTSPSGEEEEEEECLYDNPNIILRKHGVRPSSEFYSTYSSSKRNNPISETPTMKNSGNEELVEKLSLALAPPLPLRNYQKEEVHPTRAGHPHSRHSWTSQSSRNLDPDIIRRNVSPVFSRRYPMSAENTLVKTRKKKAASSSKSHEDLFHPSKLAREDHDIKDCAGSSSSKACSSLVNSFHGFEISETLPENVTEEHVGVEEGISITTMNRNSACESEAEHDKEICDIYKNSHPDRLPSDVGASCGPNVALFCSDLASQILSNAVEVIGIVNEATVDIDQGCTTEKGISDTEDLQLEMSTSPTKGSLAESNGATAKESAECELDLEHGLACSSSYPEEASSESSQLMDDFCFDREDYLRFLKMEREMEQGLESLESNVDSTQQNEWGSFERYHDFLAFLNYQRILKEDLESVDDLDVGACRLTHLKLCLKMNGMRHGRHYRHDPDLHLKDYRTKCEERNEFCSNVVEILNSKSDDRLSFLDRFEKTKLLTLCMQNLNEYEHYTWPRYTFTDYIDSDNESDEEQPSSAGARQLNLTRKCFSHKGMFVRKIPDTVLLANHALLENTLNTCVNAHPHMPFMKLQDYYKSGLFKWSRFHKIPDEHRREIEAKVRSFFHYFTSMIGFGRGPPNYPDQDTDLLRLEQEVIDEHQQKIERRLQTVQDLPTFQDVACKITKSSIMHPNMKHSMPSSGKRKLATPTKLNVPKRLEHGKQETNMNTDELSNCFPWPFENAICLPPSEALLRFQNLCKHGLAYSSYAADHGSVNHIETSIEVYDSDSEDEMITLDTYSRVMINKLHQDRGHNRELPVRPRDPRILSTNCGCRTLSGELAYAVRRRSSRRKVKAVIVSGGYEFCPGTGAHITWSAWSQMDYWMKKLVPHISPRLDFRFLLKTYAELKETVLVVRKKNYAIRGCYQVNRYCCRFQEYVFLKLLRDELCVFSKIFLKSKSAKTLATEEKDIYTSLVNLMSMVLEMLSLMKPAMHKEHVSSLSPVNEVTVSPDPFADHPIVFRQPSYKPWRSTSVQGDQHNGNIPDSAARHDAYFNENMSDTLAQWLSPQDLIPDPNVLSNGTSPGSHAHTHIMAARVPSGPVEVFGSYAGGSRMNNYTDGKYCID